MINIKNYDKFLNESNNNGKWFICKNDLISLKCENYICKHIKDKYYQFLLPYDNNLLNLPRIGNRVYVINDYNLKELNTINHTSVKYASKNLSSIIEIDIISNEFVEYIDFGDDKELISFLPKNKISELNGDDPYNNRYRQQMKIGRFLRKHSIFDNDELTIGSIEIISNIYKSINYSYNNNNTFEIVNGEEIRKWYNCVNYYNDGGTLNKSCMRYSTYHVRFDIYSHNPSVCSMIIMKNINNPNEIVGRALLWKTNIGIVMDRVYTTDDYYVYNFIGLSFKNNWLLRENIPKNTIIQLEDSYTFHNIKYTPYMDTFKFYNKDKNQLSNSRPIDTYNFIVLDYM